MARRSPKTAATGSSGQSYVKGDFEQLGWGVSPVPQEHDLGTDLWLSPRDAQGYDLLVLAGAQVKNYQQDYFDKHQARGGNGELIGWWYYEAGDSHFEYWTNHASSHFMVLRNHESGTAYWVHVTSESLVSTGKGTKVLVPESQTVSESSRNDLIAAATSTLLTGSWDGSAWSYERVAQADRLRFALLAPRLVAPHPNTGKVASDPYEAIALLIQQRFDQLESVRSADQRDSSTGPSEWAWRLFDAMHQWLSTGDAYGLQELSGSTDEPQEATALAVVNSLAALEAGSKSRALDAAHTARGTHAEIATVDDAWLKLHEARCLVEYGRYEEAMPLALDVQQLRITHPSDPTAMAIVAAATSLVFSISPWGNRDLGELVQSSDTVARLWRSQTTASGLSSHFDDNFRAWAEDQSVRFVRSDAAADSLRAVSLIAGFTADHDAWKYAISLHARRQLMAGPSELATTQSSLSDLLLTGDKKHATLAVRRIIAQGPWSVLTAIGAAMDLHTIPRSSMGASLEFLRYAGDFMEPQDADRHVRWCISSLQDIGRFVEDFRPTFLPREALAEASAGLMVAASDDVRVEFIEHVLSQDVLNDDDQLLARNYGRALRRIEMKHWTPELVARLANRSGDNWELSDAIDLIVVQNDSEYRHNLLEDIRKGRLGALHSFGDLRDLPIDVVSDLTGVLAAQVHEKIEAAKNGSYSFGADPVLALTVLSVTFPEFARWETIRDFLVEAPMPSEFVNDTLDYLAYRSNDIPSATKELLRNGLELTRDRKPIESFFSASPDDGAQWSAMYTIARWYPDTVDDGQIRKLLSSGNGGHRTAAQVISARRDPSDTNLLCLLLQENDSTTRRTAIRGLVAWILEGIESESVQVVVAEHLKGNDVACALEVSEMLLSSDLTLNSSVRDVLLVLSESPHAIVRQRAKLALELI